MTDDERAEWERHCEASALAVEEEMREYKASQEEQDALWREYKGLTASHVRVWEHFLFGTALFAFGILGLGILGLVVRPGTTLVALTGLLGFTGLVCAVRVIIAEYRFHQEMAKLLVELSK